MAYSGLEKIELWEVVRGDYFCGGIFFLLKEEIQNELMSF